MTLTYDSPPSAAIDAVRKNLERGAVAAYDRVPFVSASSSFTFNTDNGVSLLVFNGVELTFSPIRVFQVADIFDVFL